MEKTTSRKRRHRRRRLVLGALAIILLSQAFALVLAIMSAAPAVDSEYEALQSTVIYARDGEVLAGIYQEDRSYLPIEEIPGIVQEAFIAVEDRNFFRHRGVDPVGILRALYANLRHRRIVEGGSTITQQLARNLYLDRSRTITRKLKEIRIALELERRFTKEEILERYLNQIYLGAGAYGVQAAANRYFGKDLDQLSLDQAALLAALPRAPNYYSPINNHDAALGRRNLVLQRMSQNGFISEAEADAAAAQPLRITDPEYARKTEAPGFVEYVRRKLLDRFGADAIYERGLEVHTTLDVQTQVQAEAALEHAFERGQLPSRPDSEDPQPQVALISLDAGTGAIRSMIGGRGDDEFNRAVQARRHPGSAFKPFVYAAAITRGRNPGTVVNDLPRVFRREGERSVVWPRNFDDTYRGPVSFRTALARSINTAAVEVIRDIGVRTVRDHLEGYGFTSLTERDGQADHYALALGGLERGVSPLEMARAYAAFAADGVAPRSFAITKVTDRDGTILYRSDHWPVIRYGHTDGPVRPYTETLQREPVLSEAEAYVITDMLRTVVEEGTGTGARLAVPAAGKTGTSDDNRDAWFIGFAGELVSAVWIGEDTPRPMRYRRTAENSYERAEADYDIELTGVHASLIWGVYMRRFLETRDTSEFTRPAGVGPTAGNSEIQAVEHYPAVAWPRVLYLPLITPAPDDAANVWPALPEPGTRSIATVEIDALTGMPFPIATLPPDEEHLTLEREVILESAVPLGPTLIAVGNREHLITDRGDPFRGVYLVDHRRRIQKIDPATGMPVNSNEPRFLRFPLPPVEAAIRGSSNTR